MMLKLSVCITVGVTLGVYLTTRIHATQNTDMMAITAYLSGIAVTHYCTCRQWPASWERLKRFDDNLHALSRAQGQKPVERLPWAHLSQSRVTVAQDGHLAIDIRLVGFPDLDIGVPVPKDCSTLNPKVLESACTVAGTPQSRG